MEKTADNGTENGLYLNWWHWDKYEITNERQYSTTVGMEGLGRAECTKYSMNKFWKYLNSIQS